MRVGWQSLATWGADRGAIAWGCEWGRRLCLAYNGNVMTFPHANSLHLPF